MVGKQEEMRSKLCEGRGGGGRGGGDIDEEQYNVIKEREGKIYM